MRAAVLSLALASVVAAELDVRIGHAAVDPLVERDLVERIDLGSLVDAATSGAVSVFGDATSLGGAAATAVTSAFGVATSGAVSVFGDATSVGAVGASAVTSAFGVATSGAVSVAGDVTSVAVAGASDVKSIVGAGGSAASSGASAAASAAASKPAGASMVYVPVVAAGGIAAGVAALMF